MKRILTILILLVYTLTTTGATLYFHKCTKSYTLSFQSKVTETPSDHCTQCNDEHCLLDNNNSCMSDDIPCKQVTVDIEKITTKVIQINPIDTSHYLTPFTLTLHWIAVCNQQFVQIVKDQFFYPSQHPYISPNLYLVNNILRI